jgi:hypothetical protein
MTARVFRLSMTNTALSACGYCSAAMDFTSRAWCFDKNGFQQIEAPIHTVFRLKDRQT